jgi:hypothetical protein
MHVLELQAIGSGGHAPGDCEQCAMEIASILLGESHTDHPEGVSPTIGGILRGINDEMPDDATRARLILPVMLEVLGTGGALRDVELRRVFMAADWALRDQLPAALELLEEMKPHAAQLRALPELVPGCDMEPVASILNDASGVARALALARALARARALALALARARALALARALDLDLEQIAEARWASALALVRRMVPLHREEVSIACAVKVGGVYLGPQP